MSKTLEQRVAERAYYIWQKNPTSCAKDNWSLAYRQECQATYDGKLDPISWTINARIETLWSFETMRGLADEYCCELQTLIDLAASKNINSDVLLIAQNNLANNWNVQETQFVAAPLERIYENFFPEETVEQQTEQSYWQIIDLMKSEAQRWQEYAKINHCRLERK